MKNEHIPVLLDPIIEFLKKQNSQTPKNIFDGTFGGGSYSKSFLDLGCDVFACDRDPQAIELAEQNFGYYLNSDSSDSEHESPNLEPNLTPKLQLKKASYTDFIEDFEEDFFDGIVLDLGFSSNQLAFSGRGFSYQNTHEPLDLRYDTVSSKPCYTKLKQLKSPFELQKIIYTYSGEQLSKRLANAIFDEYIMSNRDSLKVGEMSQILVDSIPAKLKHKQKGILSRVWQALRIWTNQELEELENFLPKAVQKLTKNGLLMVVSFHSLEDKIVTKFMRNLSKPRQVDDYGNTIQNFQILTPKATLPTELEIQQNPRSRSAMLRVIQKID
jgi:16S rRNA (cytosine1402-N4)-methyltransferase